MRGGGRSARRRTRAGERKAGGGGVVGLRHDVPRAHPGLDVRPSPRLQECAHGVGVALLRSVDEWCGMHAIDAVRVRACSEEGSDHIHRAHLGGDVQRCGIVLLIEVCNVRTLCNRLGHARHTARLRCGNEGRWRPLGLGLGLGRRGEHWSHHVLQASNETHPQVQKKRHTRSQKGFRDWGLNPELAGESGVY